MKIPLRFLLPLVCIATCDAANAHSGGLADVRAGLAHTFTGLDHLSAMLAMGMWSAAVIRPIWVSPAVFMVVLIAGASVGFAGFVPPAVEPMIGASILVLGLLIGTQCRMSVATAALLAGVFAFFHGAAHGEEMAGFDQLSALAGMVFASTLLQCIGIVLGRAFDSRHRWLTAVTGSVLTLLGVVQVLQFT